MSARRLSSVSVFFPAYNESKNLPTLIHRADAYISSLTNAYELIVINDGSTDNSLSVIKKLQTQYSKLRVISHPINLGYGAALRTGFQEAQFDWIFFTDADLQFNIQELERFIPHTTTHDVIIGWRKERAEGKGRALNAYIFKKYIDVLYRLHVRDIDCAFKLMKRSVVQSIQLESVGAFTTSELLYKLKKKKVQFMELSVTHHPRKHGVPTGAKLSVVLRAFWESFSLYVRMKLRSVFDR